MKMPSLPAPPPLDNGNYNIANARRALLAIKDDGGDILQIANKLYFFANKSFFGVKKL